MKIRRWRDGVSAQSYFGGRVPGTLISLGAAAMHAMINATETMNYFVDALFRKNLWPMLMPAALHP